jgi:hypothetical protein
LSKQIEGMDYNISVANRHLNKLKSEGSSKIKIKNVYAMVIAAKREAAMHKKERKESNKAIDC